MVVVTYRCCNAEHLILCSGCVLERRHVSVLFSIVVIVIVAVVHRMFLGYDASV